MNGKKAFFYLIIVVIVVISTVLGLASHLLLPEWRLANEPLHSSTEAFGGLAAIIMAVFLLQKITAEANNMFLMLAVGFIVMGLLDSLHAVVSPGNTFVFLHSIASLAGGFCFSLIWLPISNSNKLLKKWLPWLAVIICIFVGVWVLLFKEVAPAMVFQGKFTTTAIGINTLAGLLFIVAASRFIVDFCRFANREIYLFSCLSILFGMAALLFQYSTLWSDVWWYWHFERLVAYLLTLSCVIYNYNLTTQEVISLKEKFEAQTVELKRAVVELEEKIGNNVKC